MRNVVVVFLFVAALFIAADRSVSAGEITITVSPNVINLASASTVVTVHTDIAYSMVDGATVEMNGIPIDWWKSDSRGYFVAKFQAGEVKGIVTPGTTAILTLSGVTALGESFSGTDKVEVIEVKKKR
jgi:hypothetical protein